MKFRKQREHKVEYAVYRGDTFIVCGSAKFCAQYLGTERNYIDSICTKFTNGKISDNSKQLYAIKMSVEELEREDDENV